MTQTEYIQEIINRAIEAASHYRDVSQVIWVPSVSAATDPYGLFIVVVEATG